MGVPPQQAYNTSAFVNRKPEPKRKSKQHLKPGDGPPSASKKGKLKKRKLGEDYPRSPSTKKKPKTPNSPKAQRYKKDGTPWKKTGPRPKNCVPDEPGAASPVKKGKTEAEPMEEKEPERQDRKDKHGKKTEEGSSSECYDFQYVTFFLV
jgi:hypothetical protein